MLARHRRLRPWRAVGYLLLAMGAIVIWWDPTRNVEPIPWPLRWVWASFIVLGGLSSAYGSLRDRWLHEFVSLPPLIGGFAVLVALLVGGGGATGRLAFACWVSFIVVQLSKRWLGLWRFNGQLRKARRKGLPDA
jgi:hypothetical protein